MSVMTQAPRIFGGKLLKAENIGDSAYGNARYRLTFDGGKILHTSPGTGGHLPVHLFVGEDVEFTVDVMQRVNDMHIVATFIAVTSQGDRWWVADTLHHAMEMQNETFPDDAVITMKYAPKSPPPPRLGKRQRAVLVEMSGGKSVLYLKPSERKTVYRALLRMGLITKEDGRLVVTPRGRFQLL